MQVTKSNTVFKYYFLSNLRIAIWYLAIFAIVVGILYLLAAVLPDQDIVISETLARLFSNGNQVFMLVVGICVYYDNVRNFVYQGVSRKDCIKGTFLAVALLSLILGILTVFAGVIDMSRGDSASMLHLAYLSVSYFGSYMIGVFISISFFGYGAARGLISVGVSIILFNLMGSVLVLGGIFLSDYLLYDANAIVRNVFYYAIPPILSVAMAAVNYKMNKSINIKAPVVVM